MIKIRKAGIGDLGSIRALAYAIWPVVYADILSKEQLEYMLGKAYSINSLEEQLLEKNHQFILIGEDDAISGFASFSEKSAEEKNICRLHKLYLAPDQHGKGLGKMLVDYVAAEALTKGAAYIELNVNRFNPTVAFYRKLGFVVEKEIVENMGNGYTVDDFIMKLALAR